MLVVKDSMILIHLAKTSVLEDSCKFFEEVIIPRKVWKETVEIGKKRKYPDAILIEELIEKDRIDIVDVEEKELIDRARKFNIQGGEAEAVALYWEKDADILATDDDNVRSKSALLNLNLVGTLPILVKMFRADKVSEEKVARSLDILQDIGWFSTAVLDKTRVEVGLI
ncbi:MAG: hypothetical protein ACOC5D_04570 [Thermoplasmatota archaeon]